METNQNGKFSVDLDLPYPPVQPETHRKEYAYAMLSNVGSDNSEMSAVSLYFYNSILLSPQHAAFARCFHQISIVEMHHLDIFASFAHQMGLDPRLWSVQGAGPTTGPPPTIAIPSSCRPFFKTPSRASWRPLENTAGRRKPSRTPTSWPISNESSRMRNTTSASFGPCSRRWRRRNPTKRGSIPRCFPSFPLNQAVTPGASPKFLQWAWVSPPALPGRPACSACFSGSASRRPRLSPPRWKWKSPAGQRFRRSPGMPPPW